MPVKRQGRAGARNRTHGTQIRRSSRSPRKDESRDESGVATSLVRLAVGAVSLGSDELMRRLRTIPRESGAGSTGPGVDDHEPGIVTLAGLGVGIAVESTQLVGRVVSTTAGGSRRAADRIRRAARLPLVNLATGPVQRQYGRYEVDGRTYPKLANFCGRVCATPIVAKRLEKERAEMATIAGR